MPTGEVVEQSEVSINQVKLYHHLKTTGAWMTNKALAAALGISLRNASLHTQRLVSLGILDQAEVFPGHRYRYSAQAKKRNLAYVQRLQEAAEIFQADLAAEVH
jgi:predicted transcriptional regulator